MEERGFGTQIPESERSYLEALELAGDPVTTMIAANNLAVIYIETERWQAATEILGAHLDDLPDDGRSRFLYNYGLALEGLGRVDEALAAIASAVQAEPEFATAYDTALRLGGRELLPDTLENAVTLVATARAAGYFGRAQDLLATFLQQASWLASPAYGEALLLELLEVLPETPVEARGERWDSLLHGLEERLPIPARRRISAIHQALTQRCTRFPTSPWSESLAARQSFARFLGRMGDQALASDRWQLARDHYRKAWDLDPTNLGAAAYLLHTLATGPELLDPEGALASRVLADLQPPWADRPALELASTLALAGDALNRHRRDDEAIDAWQLAADLSPPNSSQRTNFEDRIALVKQRQDLERPRFPDLEEEIRVPPIQQALGPKTRVLVAAIDPDDREPSGEALPPGLATQVSDQLASQMLALGNIEVITRVELEHLLREQDFGAARQLAPQPVARLLAPRADLIVFTRVLDFESRITPRLFGVGKVRGRSEIVLEFLILEANTGRLIDQSVHRGAATLRPRSRTGGSDSVERAIDAAIDEALPELVAEMKRIPWEGRVVQITEDRILFDVGASSGVWEGMELQVLRRSTALRDPETMEALASPDLEIARVTVESVQNRTASAPRPAGAEVRIGDVVRWIPDDGR